MPHTRAKRLVVFLAALALSSIPAGRASGPIPPPEVEWVPGELVVKLARDFEALDLSGQPRDLPEEVRQLNREMRVKSVEALFPSSRPKTSRVAATSTEPRNEGSGLGRWVRLRFAADVDEQAIAEQYQKLSSVEIAQPNYIFRLADSSEVLHVAHSAAGSSLKIQPHLIPNDPSFPSQWGLTYINAPQAWDITQGSPSQVIAIIDTGIDLDHPDLASKIWTNAKEAAGDKNGDGCPGLCGVDDDSDGRIDEDGAGRQRGEPGYDANFKADDDENGYIDDLRGWDFVGTAGVPDNNPQDDNGHGTHAAGIAAAATNNGTGIAGVCPQCRVMALKAFQANGTGAATDIAKAIDYAQSNGATVISMSFGLSADAVPLRDALNAAYPKATLVAAAGNDRRSRTTALCKATNTEYEVKPSYPAHYSFVLGVEANDQTGALAGFSNCGYPIRNPGVAIPSTVFDNDYKPWTGTSMAAPHVAGIAGLLRALKETDPTWTAGLIFGQLLRSGGNAHQALTLGPQPRLVFEKLQIDDRSGPSCTSCDGDGVADAGETVSLIVTIRNEWANATGVTGTLSTTTDPGVVVILKGSSNWGAVGPSATDDNSEPGNPFKVEIKPTVENGRDITFTLNVTAANGGTGINQPLALKIQRGVTKLGTLTGAETWTADNLYLVSDNLVIGAGAKLTIQAGTKIQINPSKAIIVQGELVARGTPNSRIEFSGNGGSWNGIVFQSGSAPATLDASGNYVSGCVLQYCIFKDAALPVRLASTYVAKNIFTGVGAVNSAGGILEKNLFTAAGPALSAVARSSTAPNVATTRYNTIVGNNGDAVQAGQADIIRNNNLFSNGGFDFKNSGSGNPDVSGNYWGSTDRGRIANEIFDIFDDPLLGLVTFEPFLTSPPPEAPPVVKNIVIDPPPPLGEQRATFTVTFSKPMDMSAAPRITFGPAAPFTRAVSLNPRWVGGVDVVITTPSGITTLPGAFTYIPPATKSIPASESAADLVEPRDSGATSGERPAARESHLAAGRSTLAAGLNTILNRFYTPDDATNPDGQTATLPNGYTVASTPIAFAGPQITLASSTFFGGTGDQLGRSVAISGSDLYVAGRSVSATSVNTGLLVKYTTPPSTPVWSTSLTSDTFFEGVAATSTTVFAAGAALPPTCGAVDGVGGTEHKSLLARYTPTGTLLGCQSVNFFSYRGIDFFLDAASDGTSAFATGFAEPCGFQTVTSVAKFDASGNLLGRATDNRPGLALDTTNCSHSNLFSGQPGGSAFLNGNLYYASTSYWEEGLPGKIRPALWKYDPNLNLVWKVRSTDLIGDFRGVTAFGGAIYAVGLTFIDGVANSANFLIEKYNELGTRLWSSNFGGPNVEVLNGVVGIGSRLFAVGYTASSDSAQKDAVILEINPTDGSLISTTLFGGSQDDVAYRAATDGTDLYVVGDSRSFATGGNLAGQSDVMLLRYTLGALTPPTAVVGSIALGSQPIGQIVVNPNTDRVYVSGGYAQDSLTIVNASDPANPTIVTAMGGAAGGSGVTVNPNTNRFYTSNGFGGQVLMYSGATNTLMATVSIGACPGAFDIDVTTNLVYVTRQCAGGGPPLGVDPLFVLDGDTLAIVGNNLGSGGVVGHPAVNSATGRVYVGREDKTMVLGPSPTFTFLTLLPTFANAANPVTNRIYFQSGVDTLVVRDGATHEIVVTIPGAGITLGVNTSLNHFYTLDQTNQLIKVFDGATNSVAGSVSLGPGVGPLYPLAGVDSTKNRLYVAGCIATNCAATTRLYVVQDTVGGPPAVSSLTPNFGRASGGTQVTITGSNFLSSATVTFGGVAATAVISATTITATTPAHAAGAVDVVVRNPNGQTGTLTAGFTYHDPPTLTSISPTSGPTKGGTSVTLTGSRFLAGATVTFGSASATQVAVVNATTITATTPAASAGPANVVVTNPDGQTATLPGGYTFIAPPSITSVSPASGPTGGGTSVTVTGTGFLSGAAVKFGVSPATNVTVVNSTTITCTTGSHAAGTVDVVVTNPDGQSGSLVNGFSYSAPTTVPTISPTSGPTSGGTVVTISGNVGDATAVTFGGVAGTITSRTATSITVTTPPHAGESSIWRAETNITAFTGDGLQKINVTGARDSEGFPIPSGDTRFGFEIVTTGTSSFSLQAVGRAGRVDLSWIASTDETLAGYNIYRSAQSGGPYTKLNSALVFGTTHSDFTARPAVRYFYIYRLVNTALEEGPNSNEASAIATDDAAPLINHSPVPAATTATPITIVANITDNGAVTAASLYYRPRGSAGAYTQVAMINATGTQFTANIPASAVVEPGLEYYIEATDGTNLAQHGSAAAPHKINVGTFAKGDINGDGAIGVADVVFLLNYLFGGGQQPLGPADVSGDAQVTIADVFHLINHLFSGGPPPL